MPQNNIKTKEEKSPEEENPQHPRYRLIFSLYSWWYSSDHRTFVICQRWNNNEGNIEYIEILEKDLELLKVIPYQEFFKQFQLGRLSKTSNMQDQAQPGIPNHNLWPDRVY